MNVEKINPSADLGPSESRPELYSDAWWHERSTDELRQIMSRGFELGPAFDAAIAEAERRAHERLQAEEKAAFERAARVRRVRLISLAGLLLTCLLVLTAIETIG